MNVKLYYSFYVFCESPSVAVAAQNLGLSQPALTAQLQQIQEEAAFELFQQRGRRKVLTRYGQDLHQALKNRFENLSEAVIGVDKKHASGAGARVRIAGRKELISRILNRMPDVDVRMDFQIMAGFQAAELMQKGLIDIAIVTKPPESGEIMAKTLFADPRCLCWPSSWKVPAGSLANQLRYLVNKPFLGYWEKDDLVDAVREEFNLPEFQMHRILTDWGPLVQLAARGQGWMLAPLSQVSGVKGLENASLPGKMAAPVILYICMNKTDRGIPWLKDLYEQIRETVGP